MLSWFNNRAGNQAVTSSWIDAQARDHAAYVAGCNLRLALYRRDARAALAERDAWIDAHHQTATSRASVKRWWGQDPSLRRVVNAVASSYLAAPRRALADGDGAQAPEEAQALLSALADAIRWNERMIEAERRCVLCNAVLMHVQWDGWSALPTLTVVSPHVVSYNPHPDWPSELQRCRGIAVEVFAPPTPGQPASLADRRWLRYEREDPDDPSSPVTSAITDVYGNVVGEVGLASLPDYPLVYASEWDDTSFYPEGADDLTEQPMLAANADATMRVNAHLGDFQLLAITEADPRQLSPGERPAQHAIGPEQLIRLSAGGAIQWLAPTYDFAGAQERRKAALQWWAQGLSVPSSEFDTQTPITSGVARFAARLPLIEERQLRIPAWRRFEAETWRIVAQVRAAGLAAPETRRDVPAWRLDDPDLTGYTLTATFPDPQPIVDPAEAARLRDADIAAGLLDPARILAEREGIADVEEARAMIRERKATAAAVAPESASDRLFAAALKRPASSSGGAS